ncbi:MAG: hypothetical protein LKF87_10080 [Clostridium tyrobutyricum]|jgi:hypothetical protein|uniref:hypothetical protein n=1 Tax=Clostridium tyrobutyricum TaxID=1519 RepID=UPI0011C791C1|nr:hypothetical protein [Clostridium tyrobutyricum]MCH4201322.1 hypothetical protein [Clostridium tyrobutyricum]MCH4259297.1 hypothetical protein [Clostridium tyrobutyricum]
MQESIKDPKDIIVTFRIRKNSKDDKIREFFSECKNNKERSDLARKVINFYIENNRKFKDLNDIKVTMNKILSTVEGLKMSSMQIEDCNNSNVNSEILQGNKEERDIEDKWANMAKNIFNV